MAWSPTGTERPPGQQIIEGAMTQPCGVRSELHSCSLAGSTDSWSIEARQGLDPSGHRDRGFGHIRGGEAGLKLGPVHDVRVAAFSELQAETSLFGRRGEVVDFAVRE